MLNKEWWTNRKKVLAARLEEIDKVWEARNVEDATGEAEWDEYENTLGRLAEVEEVLKCLA